MHLLTRTIAPNKLERWVDKAPSFSLVSSHVNDWGTPFFILRSLRFCLRSSLIGDFLGDPESLDNGNVEDSEEGPGSEDGPGSELGLASCVGEVVGEIVAAEDPA